MTRSVARFVLTASILAGAAATVIVLASVVPPLISDPGSHEAADALLALIVFSPQVLVTVLGIAALVGWLRGWGRAAGLSVVWGVLQSVIATLMAWRLLSLLASVVTDGARLGWDRAAAAWAITSRDGVSNYFYWWDVAAVALLVAALLGLGAAIVLRNRA